MAGAGSGLHRWSRAEPVQTTMGHRGGDPDEKENGYLDRRLGPGTTGELAAHGPSASAGSAHPRLPPRAAAPARGQPAKDAGRKETGPATAPSPGALHPYRLLLD